jgi:hypothetical protein
MRLSLLILGIVLATSALATRAQAQNYPWCALYSGGGAGGGENCGFSTREQCNATVSGIGGFCEPNNLYVPPAGASSGRRKQQKPSRSLSRHASSERALRRQSRNARSRDSGCGFYRARRRAAVVPPGGTYVLLSMQKPPMPLTVALHCSRVENPQFSPPPPPAS